MADDNNNADVPAVDLTALIPNDAARAMVALTIDAHHAYAAAHYARYGTESAGFKAWRDALPDLSDDVRDFEAVAAIGEAARVTSDPATCYAFVTVLTELLAAAKANLQSLHASKDRPAGDVDPNADVAALRDALDNMLAACIPLTATPLLSADALWSVIPGKVRRSKSGSERMVYDGPSIPQTRQSSPLRANAKLTLVIHHTDGTTTEYNDGQFGENVKAVLHIDMAQCKAVVGDFTEANFGVIFTTPASYPLPGVRFSIVKRAI